MTKAHAYKQEHITAVAGAHQASERQRERGGLHTRAAAEDRRGRQECAAQKHALLLLGVCLLHFRHAERARCGGHADNVETSGLATCPLMRQTRTRATLVSGLTLSLAQTQIGKVVVVVVVVGGGFKAFRLFKPVKE